jgi:ubiquinone biosynthesis monooxygenase Coq7
VVDDTVFQPQENVGEDMPQIDTLVLGLDKLVRVVSGVASASRANPAARLIGGELTDIERRHSAGLMRINHVGEVCAQALYDAQGRFAKTEALRRQFQQAGREEEDHLAWTAERLEELGSRTSVLNPLWYIGAYVTGVVAAKAGDANSLGFVVETERQVEAHLARHLEKLPTHDEKSKAIVEQMRVDEVEHGKGAEALGATSMPSPVRAVMRAMAKIMTTTAYYM